MKQADQEASRREGLRARVRAILDLLAQAIPDPRTALNFSTPLELLVATVLSAQCTDARVNQVTPSLFRKYRTAADYARARPEQLEEEIRPTGFFRQKAKSIQGICREIEARFGGEVPGRLEDLVTLPGVGRKTANLVLSEAFGTPGVIVDTHVKRVTQRIGLTKETDPERIEFDLMDYVPREDWTRLSNLLIWHGRRTCTARRPLCSRCIIRTLCDYPDKTSG
ncbi:MAG: endonuclease III [Thermodesulfobacteriota bacterium]